MRDMVLTSHFHKIIKMEWGKVWLRDNVHPLILGIKR
jgi:hypothetical protein